MKKIILLSILMVGGNIYAAEWILATASKQDKFYVDKSYYKYNKSNGISELWWKSEKLIEKPYTTSKGLTQYDCINKKSRSLAYVEYKYDGSVLSNVNNKDKNYGIIYPDTVNEELWKIACHLKGKGLYLKTQPKVDQEKVNRLIQTYDAKKDKPILLPQAVVDKYYNNELPSNAVKDLERDLGNGIVELPY